VSVAMRHAKLPQNAITVFAGNDAEATARARSYLVGYPPSSPAIGLVKDGSATISPAAAPRISARSSRKPSTSSASPASRAGPGADTRPGSPRPSVTSGP
jgi:putative YphP/YqiW family bacilliredoxin